MDARNILFNTMYVVLMKRWGSEEGHTYILGTYNSLEQAIIDAEKERDDRAGKYEWVVEAMPLNTHRDHWPKGIFRPAKSKEMAALTDDVRDYVVNSKGRFERYYEHQEQSHLKQKEEELILKLASIRKVLKK